jgi:ubiquinone/menaquinone biosynthesis C-methylase UbiE
MNNIPQTITDDLTALIGELNEMPAEGLGTQLRLQCGLIMLVTLAGIIKDLERDPVPQLKDALGRCRNLCAAMGPVMPHLTLGGEDTPPLISPESYTKGLFENAWTVYSPETYDHAVSLVETRLRNSGLDEQYFVGKVCFDGGCGTGRLSIAMAKMGAKKVIAADIGAESLAFFRKVVSRYGLSNIETVEMDITDLSAYADDSFDFVASYGVLHHTSHPDRGIREHFRVTKPGGELWLYLYGAGGMYWDIYDAFRPLMRAIEPALIRATLSSFKVREGLIYTYLDNYLAPRVYYSNADVERLLSDMGKMSWRPAKGIDHIDDPELQKASANGREVFGPDGEIRMIVHKGGA